MKNVAATPLPASHSAAKVISAGRSPSWRSTVIATGGPAVRGAAVVGDEHTEAVMVSLKPWVWRHEPDWSGAQSQLPCRDPGQRGEFPRAGGDGDSHHRIRISPVRRHSTAPASSRLVTARMHS